MQVDYVKVFTLFQGTPVSESAPTSGTVVALDRRLDKESMDVAPSAVQMDRGTFSVMFLCILNITIDCFFFQFDFLKGSPRYINQLRGSILNIYRRISKRITGIAAYSHRLLLYLHMGFPTCFPEWA